MAQAANPVQTTEITNFGGRLTRILNGDMNSGLAKFVQSWGYDPFSKPTNLTWFEKPADITGPISDLIVAAKPRFESSTQYIYSIGSTGNLYKIQPNSITNPNLDSVIGIASVAVGTSYSFGASMEFFGGPTEQIYIGHDNGINSINFDGTAEAKVNANTNNIAVNRYRPLRQFAGKLVFGNGPTIGVIDATNTITSSVIGLSIQATVKSIYSQLNPPLPPEATVADLDVSPNNDYLLITASNIPSENIITVSNDRQAASGSDALVAKWNGVDAATTAASTVPSYAITSLQTYLQNNYFFSNDSFGASLNDGTNKILTLPNNKSPLPNSTGVNGNFIFWIAPELTAAGTGMNASMYYFGSLDQENPPGLFRVMRYSTALASGFSYQTPVNLLTNNKYSTVNNAITAIVTFGYGKHYFSVYDVSNSTNSYKLFRFLITPTGTGTPQLGVYETQTQLFSKKITVKQVRVYTEPTAASNGFQLDFIGSDGLVITPANGVLTYTFASGTDPTKLQGALERINYNPAMKDTYALGLRITNTGTTNMTIHKIEVDWVFSGK